MSNSSGSAKAVRDSSICPYFDDGRVSTIEYIIAGKNEARMYHEYLADGYRRIGRAFYRNICAGCESCIPLRLDPDEFQLSRSQKRTMKKNEDVSVKLVGTPSISQEKIALYASYVRSKHGENEDDPTGDPVNMLLNMHYGYPWTLELHYYLNDRLIGVGVIDEGMDALSSNYFYYDTGYLDRRLGIFSILKEIELARSLGKKYYYLGFFIEKNRKMSYKKFFSPNEIFDMGEWKPFRT